MTIIVLFEKKEENPKREVLFYLSLEIYKVTARLCTALDVE